MLKAILALENGYIPGNPTFETPNPKSKSFPPTNENLTHRYSRFQDVESQGVKNWNTLASRITEAGKRQFFRLWRLKCGSHPFHLF